MEMTVHLECILGLQRYGGRRRGAVGQLVCVSLGHNQRAVSSFLIIISVSRMCGFKLNPLATELFF